MTSLDFTFGAPKPLHDPEAQMFASCLKMAQEGEPSVFPLRVAESIAITVDGRNGKTPQIATFALTFESFINVVPEVDGLAIRYNTFEGSDASSYTSHKIKVWAGESPFLEVGQEKPAKMPLPEYLRRTARDWATAYIESEIAQLRSPRYDSAWSLEQGVNVNTISYLIAEEFNSLSISVNKTGVPTLGRMRALPALRLGPDPVMGASHHLTLAYADTQENTWQDRLLTFPIADHAAADAIRSELVRRHCGEYHSGFSYDWADAVLVGADGYKGQDDRLMTFSRRFDVEGVLANLGEAFSLVFPNSGGEWKHILEALSGNDLDKQLQAIREIADIRPKEYGDFLASSGWTLPFDPLELYELRLRQHRGLDLNDEPAVQPPSSAPKP